MEFIFFGICFKRTQLNKKFLHEFKNCLFYLNQNFIIILSIIVDKTDNLDVKLS